VQRERNLADMSRTEPAEDIRWSPDPGCLEDWPLVLPLDGLGRIIGRQALDEETGRLAEFALLAQVEYRGLWHDVALVDTCHEEVHLHQFAKDGQEIARTVLLPVRDISDVGRGYDMAEKLLIVEWEAHVRRWERGR
jgi:hypothetical protein